MPTILASEAGGPQVCAFLDMLSVSEGTSSSPATVNNGYDVIVTGADGVREVFSDYSSHPFANGRAAKLISTRTTPYLYSTASGRYQHMVHDWLYYKQFLKLPDFGPMSQDRWAIQLIRERRALTLIQGGQIAAAIAACSNIWASLPGNGYGQPQNAADKLISIYQGFLS